MIKFLPIGQCGQNMFEDHYSRKQNKWDQMYIYLHNYIVYMCMLCMNVMLSEVFCFVITNTK